MACSRFGGSAKDLKKKGKSLEAKLDVRAAAKCYEVELHLVVKAAKGGHRISSQDACVSAFCTCARHLQVGRAPGVLKLPVDLASRCRPECIGAQLMSGMLQECTQQKPKDAEFWSLLSKAMSDMTYLDEIQGPHREKLTDDDKRSFNTQAMEHAKKVKTG